MIGVEQLPWRFPEMLDSRVKTTIEGPHGGLLHLRDNPEHVATTRRHGSPSICWW